MAGGIQVIIVDSGASKSLFRRRGLFTTYKLKNKMCVYTASGEPISVVGTGTEECIPNCLHVPTFENNLLSVSHTDVSMG